MRALAITAADFDALLSWLDPDREKAAARYEVIRYRLMRIFTSRGCAEAEELADETINRVALSLGRQRNTVTGDPARYLYGIAQKVLSEYTRQPKTAVLSSELEEPAKLECFEKCLESLPQHNRELILMYYLKEGQGTRNARQHLAQQLGITGSALQIRACRIRQSLQKCVAECLRNEKTES